jgi:hypothetical protein
LRPTASDMLETQSSYLSADDDLSPLAKGEDLIPDRYPELITLSAAFIYQLTPVATRPALPEFVFLPAMETAERFETIGALASWNHLWEAAQYRKRAFEETDLTEYFGSLTRFIRRLPDNANIHLVAETESSYDAYAPLYHLLPKRVLDRNALPALKPAVWPANATSDWTEAVLCLHISRGGLLLPLRSTSGVTLIRDLVYARFLRRSRSFFFPTVWTSGCLTRPLL